MGIFSPDPLEGATSGHVMSSDKVRIAYNHYERGHSAVVILVPGWFMCKDAAPFRSLADELAKRYDVVAMDCRGHNCSGGKYTFTADEEKDLEAIVSEFRPKYKKLYLVGFSMGGALVILHAAKLKNVDKVIAISAPSSFGEIESQWWRPEAWVNTIKKGEVWRSFTVRVGNLLKKKPAALEWVDKIEVPLLLLAGRKDPTVLPVHAQRLYDKAKEPKALHILEKSEHAEDLWLHQPTEFIELVDGWLADK